MWPHRRIRPKRGSQFRSRTTSFSVLPAAECPTRRGIVSIDRSSALPNVENYALNATYSLIDIATGKAVIGGTAATNVSYDTLGQQRFARISGMHDAERRAAKVISDNITARLASYFVAGS
jgi:LPS-assembly lipoprotein